MKLPRITSALTISLLLSITAYAEDGKVKMHVINVGQAESILLELPNHAVLIDAGGEDTERDKPLRSGSFYRKKLLEYLDQFFKDNPNLERTFDAVIISHPHKDHTKYLQFIVDNYKFKHLIEGGQPDWERNSGWRELKYAREVAQSRGIPRIDVKYNTVNSPELLAWTSAIEAASGVKIRFLSGRRSCNDANNESLVMRVDYGQRSILLTGDSEVNDEKYGHPEDKGCGGQLPFLLFRYKNDLSILDVDVYKVGHHGSRNGTYDKFLQAVKPEYAVMSAGYYRDQSPDGYHGYQFGHPNETLVKLLEDFVSGNRPQPATVFTMNGPYSLRKNRTVTKNIYCTCWNTKALIVTLNQDNTPITITEEHE